MWPWNLVRPLREEKTVKDFENRVMSGSLIYFGFPAQILYAFLIFPIPGAYR